MSLTNSDGVETEQEGHHRLFCGLSNTVGVATGYTLGLLPGCKSVSERQRQGCLPVETCRTLASDPLPNNSALTRCQPNEAELVHP